MNNHILSEVFEGALLPNRVFNETINHFLAFEPTLIQDSFFLEKIICFLKQNDEKKIVAGELIGDKVFLMEVEKVSYNYWIDKVFAIDGLFYTEIGITSESANWGIYLDNADFELGIVGFSSYIQKESFLTSFGKDKDIFQSPQDYIHEMDLMLSFSDESKFKYDRIIKNHPALSDF